MRKPCICAQNTPLYITSIISPSVYGIHASSVNFIRFTIVSCTASQSFVDAICLDKKLLKFKV